MVLSRDQCEEIGRLFNEVGIKASVSYDPTKGTCTVTIEDFIGLDKILLREGIKAELDAINMYEKAALMATDPLTKKVFLSIASEEKTHVGEFLEVLKRFDKEQVEKLEEGKREVEEMARY